MEKTNRIVITISAPVQAGKSIIMDRIAKAVERLGCQVDSPELEQERRMTNFAKPLSEWEEQVLESAIVEIKEIPLTRVPFRADAYLSRVSGVYPVEALLNSHVQIGDRWVIARPYVQPFLSRLQAAIAVLRGKAEAVSFYQQ